MINLIGMFLLIRK